MKQAYLELSSSLYPASTNYRYAAESMIEVPTPYGPLSIGLLSSPPHATLLRERAFHNSAADAFSGATFCELLRQTDTQKVPRAFIKHLTDGVP